MGTMLDNDLAGSHEKHRVTSFAVEKRLLPSQE
jgi:hypothetical protein